MKLQLRILWAPARSAPRGFAVAISSVDLPWRTILKLSALQHAAICRRPVPAFSIHRQLIVARRLRQAKPHLAARLFRPCIRLSQAGIAVVGARLTELFPPLASAVHSKAGRRLHAGLAWRRVRNRRIQCTFAFFIPFRKIATKLRTSARRNALRLSGWPGGGRLACADRDAAATVSCGLDRGRCRVSEEGHAPRRLGALVCRSPILCTFRRRGPTTSNVALASDWQAFKVFTPSCALQIGHLHPAVAFGQMRRALIETVNQFSLVPSRITVNSHFVRRNARVSSVDIVTAQTPKRTGIPCRHCSLLHMRGRPEKVTCSSGATPQPLRSKSSSGRKSYSKESQMSSTMLSKRTRSYQRCGPVIPARSSEVGDLLNRRPAGSEGQWRQIRT